MKKHIMALGLVAGSLISITNLAFASDGSLKIGVVDARLALQKSPQMAVASAQLDKQFKPRQQKILDAQKTLQADVDKLNKEASVMKNEDRIALQDKVISERATMQSMATTFQQDLTNAQSQAMQKLSNQLTAVISDLAKQGNYDLVLQRDAAPYFKSQLDMTNQVIQAMAKSGT